MTTFPHEHDAAGSGAATRSRLVRDLPVMAAAVLVAKRIAAPELTTAWDVLALLVDPKVAQAALAPVRLLRPADRPGRPCPQRAS